MCKKTLVLNFWFARISSSLYWIFKVLMYTQYSIPLTMWGKHKNFKDLMYRSRDMSTTKIQNQGFFAHPLCLNVSSVISKFLVLYTWFNCYIHVILLSSVFKRQIHVLCPYLKWYVQCPCFKGSWLLSPCHNVIFMWSHVILMWSLEYSLVFSL